MEYQMCTDDEVAAMRPGREYLIVRDPGFNYITHDGHAAGWCSTDHAARVGHEQPGQVTFIRREASPPLRAKCVEVFTNALGNPVAILLYINHDDTGRRSRHLHSAGTLVSIAPAPAS